MTANTLMGETDEKKWPLEIRLNNSDVIAAKSGVARAGIQRIQPKWIAASAAMT